MFKLQLKNGMFLKTLFEAIGSVISETRIKIDKKEMSLTAMDGSHICCADLHLKKEDFDLYEIKEEIEFGINLDDLVKMLKRSTANDQVTLIQKANEKKMMIQYTQENKKKVREFSIAFLDLEYEAINVSELNAMEFDVESSIDLGLLDEVIKDAEIVSEVLTINTSNSQIQFTAEGVVGDVKCELEKEELPIYKFTANTEGNFALVFLRSILKIKSINSQGSMRLKSESPIHFKFPLFEPDGDKVSESYIQYYLAPRVEEDSDSEYDRDE